METNNNKKKKCVDLACFPVNAEDLVFRSEKRVPSQYTFFSIRWCSRTALLGFLFSSRHAFLVTTLRKGFLTQAEARWALEEEAKVLLCRRGEEEKKKRARQTSDPNQSLSCMRGYLGHSLCHLQLSLLLKRPGREAVPKVMRSVLAAPEKSLKGMGGAGEGKGGSTCKEPESQEM